MPVNLVVLVQYFRAGEYTISKHAYDEMDADEITESMVEAAVGDDAPMIIEDDPNDPLGPSCLILATCDTSKTSDESVHLKVAYGNVPPAIPNLITAYLPDLKIWQSGFRQRRSRRPRRRSK